MSENKKGIDGYQPKETVNRGYQPQYAPTGDPKIQGGYQPTTTGSNPVNIPIPPSEE